MNYHQRLYRTRALLDEVTAVMNTLASRELRSISDLDIHTIVYRRGEFQHRLRECFYNIIDHWPDILINEARRFELSNFLSRYRSFRHSIRVVVEEPGLPTILSDAVKFYIHYLEELDVDMAIILAEFQDAIPEKSRPSLKGIARRLRYYVEEADDEFYERLILEHRSPSRALRWKGSKVAATLFARHFGLTDSEMNRAFVFSSHGKAYRGLKISSNIATKGDDRHGISAILKDYPNPR